MIIYVIKLNNTVQMCKISKVGNRKDYDVEVFEENLDQLI